MPTDPIAERLAFYEQQHAPDPGYDPPRCPECHYTRWPCDTLDRERLIARLARVAEAARVLLAELSSPDINGDALGAYAASLAVALDAYDAAKATP